jgi:hypothetical protein
VALQGTLDTFALPDVLRLLAATRKTGRLRITGGHGSGSAWVAGGDLVAVEAAHAPHATSAVDAMFELLRFEEGSFTFDADATPDEAGSPTDVEELLAESEALLAEWRTIESVVPSMDAWVTLRRTLGQPEISIGQDQWTTVVAVGAGATVRRIGDELCLPELPVSRAIKELVEAGLLDIGEAPAGSPPLAAPAPAVAAAVTPDRPLLAPPPDEVSAPAAPIGPRARRARGIGSVAPQPEVFVPMDLPGSPAAAPEPDDEAPLAVDDLAAAFPGLANRASSPVDAEELEEEEVAKQLATLSPRAADAIRAAAEATTDEERDAALEIVEDEEQPLNRGLLLKFLSSVKS